MKKLFFPLLAAGVLIGGSAFAQTAKKEVKKDEKKEIIIKDGPGKDEKMVIVIDNGNVTINGKPAKDYKGKKKIVINDGDDDVSINDDVICLPRHGNMVMHGFGEAPGQPLLGVVTKKVEKGVAITEVMDESAAEKAGLKEGDVITAINDKKITDEESLVEAVRSYKPEESVDVTYLRDNTEKKVKAVLGKSKEPFAMSWNMNEDGDMEPPMAMAGPRAFRNFQWNNDDGDMWVFRSDRPKYGMSIEDNADGDGVKVTDLEAGSNAEKAGLKKDDIITEVGGKAVKGTDELLEALKDTKDKATISIKILRSGSPETLTVRVPKMIKKADL